MLLGGGAKFFKDFQCCFLIKGSTFLLSTVSWPANQIYSADLLIKDPSCADFASKQVVTIIGYKICDIQIITLGTHTTVKKVGSLAKFFFTSQLKKTLNPSTQDLKVQWEIIFFFSFANINRSAEQQQKQLRNYIGLYKNCVWI